VDRAVGGDTAAEDGEDKERDRVDKGDDIFKTQTRVQDDLF
jgi:hypothetical protein